MTFKETAIAAVRAAGEIQKAHRDTALTVDARTEHDVKLETDRLCEAAIIEIIRSNWPDHAILAEESGASGGDAEYRWIIDPLDGTVNYLIGQPYFCSAVACYRRPWADAEAFPRDHDALGVPVAAAVYAPPTDELFAAEAGKGATLNGRPIHVNGVETLAEGVFSMGFGGWPGCHASYIEGVSRLAPRVRKLRCPGAGAYDLCNVAAGRFAGFYEGGIRSWDIAAARVILIEAGAEFRAEEYKHTYWNVATGTPGVFAELLEIIPDLSLPPGGAR